MRDRLCVGITALTLLLATATARASSPNLGALRPVGGQRGTEVEINLTGARLGDAKEVLFYQPGITVTKIQPVNDGQVKATFKIAPDSRLGLYDLRLRTATGLSELRTFSVGALKETNEVEPNNDFAKPQPIPLDITVDGVAESEDVDYFAVDLKKGERITAEVEGIRLGITLFDPYVAILDSKRFELASSDDAALVWQDAVASAVAPADGRYIIQVRESAYAGNGACLYRLHVGHFPRYTATLPAGGKLGETLTVKWIGDVLGEKTAKATLPATFARDFGLQAQDERGLSPYPNAFRLSPLSNVLETEPNDDHAKATPFSAPMALNGVIGTPGDVDHYVFPAKKGQAFDIRVYARALRSPLDSVLYIGKKGQGAAAGNDDSGSPDSYIRFGVPDDGDYVIAIHDQLKKGGPDYAYRIELTPVAPKVTMGVPAEQMQLGTGAMAVAVPKGNRQAILVTGGRADFGGDLKVNLDGLPAGVTVETDPMAANQAVVPVLFSAKSDADLTGTLAQVSGQHVDPKQKIASEFAQTSMLVLGQNNVPFWTRTVDRLAVAVTDLAPFSIKIVEPKVPMVRGGSMGLKVVAERKAGFTAPIAIGLPWNPPGVSSAGGIAIPEKQNEAVIPMNASGDAELKTWKIVVNGTATVGNGPIMVSTQLAPLSIAAPFVSFTYPGASVEQGKEVDFPVKITKNTDFPGEAQVTLVGLPNKVTTEPKTITKDTTDLVFHVKTDASSPAGKHTSLFCQVVVTEDGEPIVHNLGSGELRIDVPLPAKPNTPAPAAAAAPKTAAPAAAPKTLTRLEKLRQEHLERAQAAAQGKPAPAPEGGSK